MNRLCILCTALGLAGPAPGVACDLALLLAVDVSGSVDSPEYRIQMDGLAAGLRDPIVSEALVRAQAQVAVIQWTGSSRQSLTIPWVSLRTFDDIETLAAQIETDQRVWRNFSTAIGEALAYSIQVFEDVAHCKRHLIDLSGDGLSNEGVAPTLLRPQLRQANITVNAIAIEQSEPDLTAYFYENVIFGEGAFVMLATTFADYPERIRKKLLREVTQQTAAAGVAPGFE